MTDTLEMDLFTALGLDPEDPWSEAAFDAAYRSKNREWGNAKTKGMPAKKLAALQEEEFYKQHNARFRADESVRAVHAQRARQRRAEIRAARMSSFESQLQLQLLKPALEESEVMNFVRGFKDILTEDEIRKRITVPIIDTTKETQQKLLPSSTRRDIESNLATLGLTTLYDFLGFADNKESSKLLHQKAVEISNKILKDQRKNDPDNLAKQALASQAMRWFGSDADRAIYDATLLDDTYLQLEDAVTQARDTSNRITAVQIQTLMENALSENAELNPETARNRIVSRANLLKMEIEVPSLDLIKAKQRCGWCKHLNDPAAAYCTGCARPLKEPCPSCKAEVSSSERACKSCGFPVGQRESVEKLLKSAEEDRAKHNFESALRSLQTASDNWNVRGTDPVLTRITTLRSAISQQVGERAKLLAEIQRLINERKFIAADHKLQSVPMQDPKRTMLAANIASELATAKSNYAKAQKLKGEQAVRAYQQILANCADYAPAQSALRSVPPEAPSDLRATVTGNIVQLHWRAGQSTNVKHIVVRKSGSRPSSISDGEKIATVGGFSVDDTTPPIGESLYYAVYTDRDGVYSQDNAQLTTPVLITANVTNIVSRTDATSLSFSWHPPSHVKRVFAVRSNTLRAPANNRDGTIINSSNGRELIDTGLIPGQVYQYAIYCEYEDHLKKPVVSSGAFVSARPTAPPKPITDLRIESVEFDTGKQLRMNWTPADQGQTHIIATRHPMGTSGDVVSVSQIPQLGAETLKTKPPITIQSEGSSVRYYTPVVAFEGSAYLGKSVRHVDIPDVEGLRALNHDSAIQLYWKWPKGVQQVLLSTSIDRAPNVSKSYTPGPNGDANRRLITRAEYDEDGGAILTNLETGTWHFVAQVVLTQGAETLLSRGQQTQLAVGNQARIEYEISRPRFSKKRYLVLRTQVKTVIPTVVLQGNFGAPPIYRTTGEELLRLNGPLVVDEELTVEIPPMKGREDLFAKLFAADEATAHLLVIQHPLPDRLRL